MSTIWVMPSRSSIEIHDLLSYTYVQLQKLCLEQVVTIELGQVVTTVTTLWRLVPMVQPASCVLTKTERITFI